MEEGGPKEEMECNRENLRSCGLKPEEKMKEKKKKEKNISILSL